MHIRDRIQDFRRVKASLLRPNPKNWRTHPAAQRDALKGVLAEIGYAGALVARELPDGSLELIDGHLRAETTPEADVPVLVVDLDDAEAARLLAVLDPLESLAGRDDEARAGLVREVETSNEAVRRMLDDMLAESEAALTALSSPDAPEPDERPVGALFQVVVECRDENEQREVFERLSSEGYKCRLLML